jgi:hypothetical protein
MTREARRPSFVSEFCLQILFSQQRKLPTMSRLSIVLSLSLVGLATNTQALTQNALHSRRAFVKVGSAASMGFLVNFNHNDACQCGQCTTTSAHGDECPCNECLVPRHGAACQCGFCGGGIIMTLRPPAAMAYERDVGGTSRSADSAAFNIQARETNARLERDGFKLDTKEEEASRLSGALSSFSYDASTPKQATGRGYGNKKRTSSPSEKK